MSLELIDVSFAPRGPSPSSTKLLDGVNVAIAAGELVGIGAPSGAGKSTLLRIAALMTPADSGTVAITGQVFAPGASVPRRVRQSLGVVLQSPRAAADPRLRLESLICAPLAIRDSRLRPRPGCYSVPLAELAELVELDPSLLRHYPHQVSDGQLQRAMVARALALDPAVIICDEPTAQLDARTTSSILGLLARRAAAGAAVLIASHDHRALSRVAHTMVDLARFNHAGYSA